MNTMRAKTPWEATTPSSNSQTAMARSRNVCLLLLLVNFISPAYFSVGLFGQGIPESFVPIQDKSHFQLSITGDLVPFPWPQLRHKFELNKWELMTHPELRDLVGLDSDTQSRLDRNVREYETAYKALLAALKGKGDLPTEELRFERVARNVYNDLADSLSPQQMQNVKILHVRRELILRGCIQILEFPSVKIGKMELSNSPIKPDQLVELSKSLFHRTDGDSELVFANYVDIILEDFEKRFGEFSREWLVLEIPGNIELELLLIREAVAAEQRKSDSKPIDLDWINTDLLYRLDSMGKLEAFQYSGFSGMRLPIATLIADQSCIDSLDFEMVPFQFDAINPVYRDYLNRYDELRKTLSRETNEMIRERLESEIRGLGNQFNSFVKQTLLSAQWKQLEKIALRRMLYQEGTAKVFKWLAKKYEEETGTSIDLSELEGQVNKANAYLREQVDRLSTEFIDRYKTAIVDSGLGANSAILEWLEIEGEKPIRISLSLLVRSCRDYLQRYE